jgi:hypothetical protein
MEDHSTIVRALCERIRKLEDTVMKYKLRITELNCIVEGLDDGARYVVLPENSLAPTLTIAPDTSSDSSTVSSSLAPLASEPAVETKKIGRPLKEGVDEKRRARRQRYYLKSKEKKATTDIKPNETVST